VPAQPAAQRPAVQPPAAQPPTVRPLPATAATAATAVPATGGNGGALASDHLGLRHRRPGRRWQGGNGGTNSVNAGTFNLSNNMSGVGAGAAGITVVSQNSGISSLVQQSVNVQSNLNVGQ
jgi:hypothetical protein